MPVYTFTTFDDPSASTPSTLAHGLNDMGQIVGTYISSSKEHGFLLSGGTYTIIDDPLGAQRTEAWGISGAGQIVGDYVDASSNFHGFFYTGGTYITIDFPGATGSEAFGINGSGQIVGLYANASGQHGFLYNPTGNTYTTIDFPGANGTFAQGINAAGQIVGQYRDTNNVFHGFLYNPSGGGTYTSLDDPLATAGTEAAGINDLGQIVGTYGANGVVHGFLYSGGFFTTIDDPSATTSTTPQGINNAGQIVGSFRDASGTHGFLATLGPNPPPPAGTTADMILRGSTTSPIAGQYEIYDIGNNAILAGYSLGQVGTTWAFVTLAGFFSSDTTDMLLRNTSTGGFEVYDITNNNITNAAFLGNVGILLKLGDADSCCPRHHRDSHRKNVRPSNGIWDACSDTEHARMSQCLRRLV